MPYEEQRNKIFFKEFLDHIKDHNLSHDEMTRETIIEEIYRTENHLHFSVKYPLHNELTSLFK